MPELPDDLRGVDALLRTMAPADPAPPALRARTLAAVAAAGAGTRPSRAPRRRIAWAAGLVAAAAALVAAVVLGLSAGRPGELELRADLHPPGSSRVAATADVRMLGIGREISFRSTALPILPKGEFYELWFASPRDRPGRLDRISAGTFHPDPEGVSDVRLTAAVDPARYPILIVTAESGDGNPRPSRNVVLRSGG
jgi:Anti-sigma-K factor rskA